MMTETRAIENPIIESEILRARDLYDRYGRDILADRDLGGMLARYHEAISYTRETMSVTGMVRVCAACALDGDGSCCFREVEDWYDFVLLLINLLMGTEIPLLREVPGNCLFLGKNGCSLIAKHSFCINYLCPGLKAFLGPSTSVFLSTAGYELFCGWELERSLHIWIHENGM